MIIEIQLQDMGQPKMDMEVQKKLLKSSKISFEVQASASESCFKTQMTFKHILEITALISALFPCIKYLC